MQKFGKMTESSLFLFFQSLAVFFTDRSFHGSTSHFRFYRRRRATAGSSSSQKPREALGFDSGK